MQSLTNSHLKRTFLASFANTPQAFIQTWLESQSRDLENILGSGPSEGATLRQDDLRRSEYFRLPWVEEAVAIQEGLRLAAKAGMWYFRVRLCISVLHLSSIFVLRFPIVCYQPGCRFYSHRGSHEVWYMIYETVGQAPYDVWKSLAPVSGNEAYMFNFLSWLIRLMKNSLWCAYIL